MKNKTILYITPILWGLYIFLSNLSFISKNKQIETTIQILIIISYCLIDIKYGIAICILFVLYNASQPLLNTRLEGMTKSKLDDILNNILEEIKEIEEIEEIEKTNSVIPLNIFQTWETKNLPPKMQECVDRLKQNNPEFKYYLYDDADCRKFIQENFDPNVLNAYDTLVPGAYKADLWRYCILYKKGGIYLDIKFQTEPGFKLIQLTDKEYFVLDRPFRSNISLEQELKLVNDPNFYDIIKSNNTSEFWQNNHIGLYNAVMVCKPKNPILMECINKIVENVKKKDYGYTNLYITGPGLLGDIYFKGDYSKLKDIDLYNSLYGSYIFSKNLQKIIIQPYPEYRMEQQSFAKKKHYSHIWHEKKVFGE